MGGVRKKSEVSHWPISILNGISAGISLILPVFISRYLPGEEVGKYKILFLYMAMIPSLSLTTGIENGIYYWSGLLHNAKNKIRSAWSIALIQSLLFIVVVLIFSPFIKKSINWSWKEFAPFAFAGLVVPLSPFYEALLTAQKKVWPAAFFAAIFNNLNTVSMLLAIIFFKSAVIIAWSYVLTLLIKLGFSYYLGRKEDWVPAGLDLQEGSSVRKYYLPVSVSGIFEFLMNNSDRFLLSLLITPLQFASYTFGCLPIPPLQILESGINRVIIPQIARAMERKDGLHAAQLYCSSLEEIMLFFVPSFVGLFVFAEPIVQLLFTEKYLDSAPFLRLYSFCILFSGVPFDLAARASGDGKWILKNKMSVGTFSLLLCALLTWRFGVYGALSSMIVTSMVQRGFGFNLMVNSYGWPFKELIPVKSLLLYFSVAGTLGLGSFFLKSYFSSGIVWFLSCGIPFGIIYLGILYFLRKDLFEGIPFFKKKATVRPQ